MPKPTVTTTSGTTSTGNTRASTPALTLTTPNKDKGNKPNAATLFTRRPVVDDNLSLSDVVRSNKVAKTKVTATATPTTPDTPRASRPAKTPTAAPTANDGRAQRLNEGNNVGTRDERIDALKATKAKLETEETQIEGEIEDLEDEIESDEGKTSIVKTGIGIATAPVGALFGAFGKSNPLSDAAGAVTENLLGLEEDRDDLKAQESELDSQQAEIEAEIKKLETEQVLNFLADTAHVTDMDDKVVDFIEDGETQVGDLDVRLNVADETGTGSDGVFDSGTNAITVDSEILADAKDKMDELREAGIVDGDGNIVNAQAFDRASAGDDVIKSVSLLAVHELNHATQHSEGSFNSAFESARSIVNDAIDGIAPGTAMDAAGNILKSAAAAGEAVRTEAIEVDSYRLQEQNDLKSGATKKAFITIDENGEPLPEAEQLANVLAYQEGRPLEFGPTVGYVRAESGGTAQDHDHDGDGSTDGDHSHDQKADGYRGPGETADGYRGPGYRGPGETADGYRGPGYRGPGEIAAGFLGLGYRGPGETADGYRGPGYRGPGETADGYRGPGYRGPGEVADGYRGPGYRGPGEVADGYRGPGYRGPGEVADGYRGPGTVAD